MSTEVYYWCKATVAITTAILCWRTVYKEITNRKVDNMHTKEPQNNNEPPNLFQKWLDRWSMLTFIFASTAVTIMPFDQIFTICRFIRAFTYFFYFQAKIWITFYQIARLQFCFAQSQVHSKYGYSKRWFIFLYFNGVILTIFNVYSQIDTAFVSKYHRHSYRTCIADESSNWEVIEELIINGTFFYYGVWDWTVFMCYIIKICQYYKKSDKVEESISKRIMFIVYKIAFLTAILEVVALIVVILYDVIHDDGVNWILRLILNVFLVFEAFITVYLVYLMVDHNNNEYVVFIKRLNTIGMFCCCKSFVDIALEMEIVDSIELEKGDMERAKTDQTNYSENMPKALAFQQKSVATELIGNVEPYDIEQEIVITMDTEYLS